MSQGLLLRRKKKQEAKATCPQMQDRPPLGPESASQAQSPVSLRSFPHRQHFFGSMPSSSLEHRGNFSISSSCQGTERFNPLPSRDPPFPPNSREIPVCTDVLVPAAHEVGPPKTAPLQSPPPLRHSSKTTPHIVDEICAALPVDIEDLPTTVPIHTTGAKPLKPSTQDKVTVEAPY
jgi:hypothetical protein